MCVYKKTVHRMGENIHKKSNQQGINLQIYNELMQLKVKKKKQNR